MQMIGIFESSHNVQDTLFLSFYSIYFRIFRIHVFLFQLQRLKYTFQFSELVLYFF